MPAKRKPKPILASKETTVKKAKPAPDDSKSSSSQKTKARLGSHRSRRLYESLSQIIHELPYVILTLITSYDVEYRLYSLDDRGRMCVWSYEEEAARMEYVATETTTPTASNPEHFLAEKIIPCTGGYVIAHCPGSEGSGDFNLLRALPDPSHGGYTLDYRLICARPKPTGGPLDMSVYVGSHPIALCALPQNRVLGVLPVFGHLYNKLVVYQLHDHDDSKNGDGTIASLAEQTKRVNLSDLSRVHLPNYALWDSLTLRTGPNREYLAEGKHQLSHIRRMVERYESNCQIESKLLRENPFDLARRQSVSIVSRDLEICRVLLKSSPLALVSRSNDLDPQMLLDIQNKIQKKFQIPDVWLTPFTRYELSAPQVTHMLPMPSPYEHVVVCWNAVRGSFVLFDSEARCDVGACRVPAPQPTLNFDVMGASLMWYDGRSRRGRKHAYGDNVEYIFVTYIRSRFTFYQIERAYACSSDSPLAAFASASSDSAAASASTSSDSASATPANDKHDSLSFTFKPVAFHQPISDVRPSAVCCTWRFEDYSAARLVFATEDGSLYGYEMGYVLYNSGYFTVNRMFGPITHRRYGVRSKRKAIATTMCALPGGYIATTGGEDDGMIRIWNLNEPAASDGVAVTVELRAPEHAGRRIIDLQLAAIK